MREPPSPEPAGRTGPGIREETPGKFRRRQRTWLGIGLLAGWSLVAPAWAQPEFSEEQGVWRGRPEWHAMDEAFREIDEPRILEMMGAHPELARIYSPPFTSALGWAAGNGATNLLVALIRQGAMERERRRIEQGLDSVVGEAAEGGWASSLEILFEAGANAEDAGAVRGAPLDRMLRWWDAGGPGGSSGWSRKAPESERERALLVLLKAGASLFVSGSPSGSETVLDALQGRPPALRDFILTNAIPARQTNAAGDTLLHLAARLGATQALEFMLARGDDPAATNRAGWTALHAVARVGGELTPGGSSFGDIAPEWSTWISGGLLDDATRATVAARLSAAGLRPDLFVAAGLGDTNALEALFREGRTDFGVRDDRGRTPLHWAVVANRPAAVRWLAARGAELAAVDADGNTALHLAVLRWPNAVVPELLDRKAPLEVRNRDGRSPLHVAGYSAEAIRFLVKAGAAVNPVEGEPPLFRSLERAAGMAANRNRFPTMMMMRGSSFPMVFSVALELEPVSALLDVGARLDVRNDKGRSPMEIACDAGAMNLIELLVLRGVSPNSTSANGTPAWFGILRHAPKLPYCERASWRYRAANTLPTAVRQGLEKMGWMPAAPTTQLVPVLGFLERWGADLRATDAAGRNALHALATAPGERLRRGPAMRMGPFGPGPGGRSGAGDPAADRIARLSAAGVPVEARDRDGNTPWLWAWMHQDADLGRLLAKAGADVRATNAAGRNALHLACLPGPGDGDGPRIARLMPDISALPYLLNLGVNPKARDSQGCSPLHYAIGGHNPPSAAIVLVQAGADPGEKDNQGMTPIAIARASGRADLLPLLTDPLAAPTVPVSP